MTKHINKCLSTHKIQLHFLPLELIFLDLELFQLLNSMALPKNIIFSARAFNRLVVTSY